MQNKTIGKIVLGEYIYKEGNLKVLDTGSWLKMPKIIIIQKDCSEKILKHNMCDLEVQEMKELLTWY